LDKATSITAPPFKTVPRPPTRLRRDGGRKLTTVHASRMVAPQGAGRRGQKLASLATSSDSCGVKKKLLSNCQPPSTLSEAKTFCIRMWSSHSASAFATVAWERSGPRGAARGVRQARARQARRAPWIHWIRTTGKGSRGRRQVPTPSGEGAGCQNARGDSASRRLLEDTSEVYSWPT